MTIGLGLRAIANGIVPIIILTFTVAVFAPAEAANIVPACNFDDVVHSVEYTMFGAAKKLELDLTDKIIETAKQELTAQNGIETELDIRNGATKQGWINLQEERKLKVQSWKGNLTNIREDLFSPSSNIRYCAGSLNINFRPHPKMFNKLCSEESEQTVYYKIQWLLDKNTWGVFFRCFPFEDH